MSATHYMLDPFGNSSHQIILREVPANTRVLDVGCASGYVAAHLRAQHGCSVVGIEQDPVAAAVARSVCNQVYVGDALTVEIPEQASTFDVLLFADVLEHTACPQLVLDRFLAHLQPGGRVILSLPNVAYWTIRAQLLLGRFEYQDKGILDRTHLRFFTLASAKQLVQAAGLRIERIQYAGRLIHFVPVLHTLLAYQFVLTCTKPAPAEAAER